MPPYTSSVCRRQRCELLSGEFLSVLWRVCAVWYQGERVQGQQDGERRPAEITIFKDAIVYLVGMGLFSKPDALDGCWDSLYDQHSHGPG